MSDLAPPHSVRSSAPEWADPKRESAFLRWLAPLCATHGLHAGTLRVASADASFRRYLRIESDSGSRIIMDAPPEKEDCRPFINTAALMDRAGLRVPKVLAWDEAQGFMLLSDLGSRTMMEFLDQQRPAEGQGMFLSAVEALIRWQRASRPGVLPAYDEALLRRELSLFPDWYLARHRGLAMDVELRAGLDKAFGLIIERNLSAPPVYVHRDFMPRNLMPPPPQAGDDRMGVLDFQDAVFGPVTYDIASLMRDAFISWDEDFVLDITVRYWERARKAGLPVGDDFGEFYRQVEWMGLQRHLKVAGIFARLTLRDGKPKYLADTPRFIGYIRATCARYRELTPLLRLIERAECISPVVGYAPGRI